MGYIVKLIGYSDDKRKKNMRATQPTVPSSISVEYSFNYNNILAPHLLGTSIANVRNNIIFNHNRCSVDRSLGWPGEELIDKFMIVLNLRNRRTNRKSSDVHYVHCIVPSDFKYHLLCRIIRFGHILPSIIIDTNATKSTDLVGST